MRPVAIIGAQAVTQEAFTGARLEEVVFDTVAAALKDAGVVREELDGVALGASDELDGRSITSMLLAMPAGAFLKDEIRTTSGMHALALQAMRIQSGMFDLGVAVSWSKPSETSSVESVQWTSLDPFLGRDVGLIDPIASAVMASAYLERFGRTRGDLDRRSEEKARVASSDGSANTPSSVSYPLRAEHLATIVDGVAVVVVASPRAVEERNLRHAPVWLRGLGWATDSYSLSERALWEWPALRRVTKDALGRAGCQMEEIDQFEIDDYSVMHEVLAVEALGLAEPGTGFDYLSAAEENGRQINPTGGSFGGYPPVCAGLWRVVEAYRSLVDGGVRRALAHGTTGIAAQGHEVAVLERG